MSPIELAEQLPAAPAIETFELVEVGRRKARGATFLEYMVLAALAVGAVVLIFGDNLRKIAGDVICRVSVATSSSAVAGGGTCTAPTIDTSAETGDTTF